MASKPDPFRKCQAAGCFRHADPDYGMCRQHVDEVLRDAIRRAREEGISTEARSDHDLGHGERHD